jgi:DNA-binding XRE family transcriptional regulator
MQITITHTSVGDTSTAPANRPSDHSFQWSDAVRPVPSLHHAAVPLEPPPELASPDAASVAASSAPASAALDVSSRFGLRLRELRRERNLTQLRMARDFGIDRSFISDVERGRKSISLPMLEVIALGMKMSLSDLLKNL